MCYKFAATWPVKDLKGAEGKITMILAHFVQPIIEDTTVPLGYFMVTFQIILSKFLKGTVL